jgi:phosphonoacetate hydrolase
VPEGFTCNGRQYRCPRQPTLAICVDGTAPAYLYDALERDLMPRLAAVLADGGSLLEAEAQVPTVTNTNNATIVTGVTAAVHGIAGNHYLAPDGSEVQLTDPAALRAQTIHAAAQQAGVAVLVVTAKDKLTRLLGAGGVPAISAERAHEQTVDGLDGQAGAAALGAQNPEVYDPGLSAYALDLALHLAERLAARLVYCSLTDYVQHKAAPGEPLADEFCRQLDERLGRALDVGWVIGMVADHGMNSKTLPDGSPNVRYLRDALTDAGIEGAHVVLPITDPYVLHHGALGSFAWVYLPDADRERARAAFVALDGVEEVYERAEAAVIFEHPADRIGDLSVASDARTALGKAEAAHDLSLVATGLRSHGGRHEQVVPIVVSHRLSPRYATLHAAGAQSRDLFDFVLNGVD